MVARASAGIASLVALTIVAANARQLPPQATFKAGVDLILIDVTVLDKDGKPIADLQAKDFSVKVGGKTRTVAAVEYIPAGRAAAKPALGPVTSSASTSASVEGTRALLASSDRTIMIGVDVDNIRSGAGRNGLVDVAEYVATLPPSDRVGLVTLPGGGHSLEPTADRAALLAALSRTAGVDHRMNSCDATIGEAAAEAVMDDRGYASFAGRARPPRCPLPTRSLLQTYVRLYRNQARQTLRALTSLANNLAAVPGRRAIVLVSEGLYVDNEIIHEELPVFGATLERSRTTLYAIHLDFPFSEAGAKNVSADTRRLDDRYGFDGMADAAVFGGGAAIRAISRATPAIRQIDQELSGIYLLGVERLPDDPVGRCH